MDQLQLYVSVPLTSFRVAQAREYWETYPCPPPATVYGMLLSLVGETDRLAHEGAEIAIALLSEPQRSVVLRTLWRVKNSKVAPGLGGNKRPDFQELLTDVRFLVWVRMGADANAALPLVRRLASALDAPAEVKRFGGLSLGESTCLVDEVRQRRGADPARGRFLIRDEEGELSLPVWPDHVGSRGTRWDQFRLSEARALADGPPAECWVRVCRQEG